jgi:hypothetical protein
MALALRTESKTGWSEEGIKYHAWDRVLNEEELYQIEKYLGEKHGIEIADLHGGSHPAA